VTCRGSGSPRPVVRDARVCEQAEAGVDPVDGFPAGNDAVDRLGGVGDTPHRGIVEPRFCTGPQIPQSSEIDCFRIELHEFTIGKSRPCSWAQSMAMS
jgi:hypothetical protein